jgi:hypothetical protein
MAPAAAVSTLGLSGVRLGKLPGRAMPFPVASLTLSGRGGRRQATCWPKWKRGRRGSGHSSTSPPRDPPRTSRRGRPLLVRASRQGLTGGTTRERGDLSSPTLGRYFPRPGTPLSASPEEQLKASLETVPNRPPGPQRSAHHVKLRDGPTALPDTVPGRLVPCPRLSAGPLAYLAGGQGRAAGSGGREGAGRGPGTRCRWRRRRLGLLSLQLPLSRAPPPPPPPAFPLGLLRCQERPNPGSASSRSLPGELQPASSAGARRPSRACAPAFCPAQALPERSR